MGEHVLACVDRTGYPLSAKIQVRREVVLPASTEMQVPCHLTNCTAGPTGLTENLPSDDHGFRTATSLVTVDEKRRLSVRCINPHPQPVTIPAGTVIGLFSVVTEEQVDAAQDTQDSPPISSQPHRRLTQSHSGAVAPPGTVSAGSTGLQ